MKKVHQALHLQHHRHTGRVLHHRHTSYRGLGLVLVLATAGIVGLNVMAKVTADSLYVSARIAAPIPTDAAVITAPVDGAVFHKNTLAVTGTCPVVTPRVVITIVDNGNSVGSAACDSSNTFTVPISVSPGDHTLVARSITITGDAGPDSDPVHITYIAPETPPNPTPSTPSNSPTPTTPNSSGQPADIEPLSITPGQDFIVYGPSRDATWLGTFNGGVPPYEVRIDWGDGTTDTYTITDHDQHSFTHHYHHMGSYDITVQITDSAGSTPIEHFAAVTPYIPPLSAGSTTGNGFWSSLVQALGGSKLVGLYLSYLALLSLFGALYLRRHPFAYAKVPVTRHATTARRYAAAKRRKHRANSR